MLPDVVLVAHEDPIQHQLIDMLLSPDAPELVFCKNGREALAYLRDHTPDLAILDYGLPQIGGHDICAKMKSIRRLAGVPVVLTVPPPPALSLQKRRDLAAFVRAELVLPHPLGDKNLQGRVATLLAAGAKAQRTPPPDTTLAIEEMLQAPELAWEDEKRELEGRVAELEAENRRLRSRLASLRGEAEELEGAEASSARKRFGLFKK